MKQDKGLWLVEGKVCSNAERKRVWAHFTQCQDVLYSKQRVLEERYHREMATLSKAHTRLSATEPYTPWVGRVDSGANSDLVKEAEREYRRRQRLTNRKS